MLLFTLPGMNSIRLHSLPLAFFAMLALVSILLAPVAALAHQNAASATVDDITGCGHCKSHNQTPQNLDHQQQDDCCKKTACPCACHAPLVAQLPVLSHPPVAVGTPLQFVLNKPPQVYLPIYVPPQNLI